MLSNFKILMMFFVLIFLVACEEKQEEPTQETTQVTQVKKEENKIVPVEVMEVSRQIISQEIKLTGVLSPDKTVEIYPEVAGKIEKMSVAMGDRVSKNDTLAWIDSDVFYSNYLQAESQVMTAENALEIARLNLQSDKVLFENGDISKLTFDNSTLNVKSAEASLLAAKAGYILSRKNFYDTRLTAPISGYISRKYADPGAMVSQATPVYRIVDISVLKVTTGIAQDVVSRVKKGIPAEIDVAPLNHEKFTGYVANLSPQADESTGTYPVEIKVNNTSDSKLKPGMTCEISLKIDTSREELVVPAYAIVKRDGESYIYKVENDFALLTKVVEGISVGENIAISQGISSGDKIVITGTKNLGEKTGIKIENEIKQ